MRKLFATILAAGMLLPGVAMAGPRQAETVGLLLNPTLTEGAAGPRAAGALVGGKPSKGTPKYWTERGTLLTFSTRAISSDGYQFSMTGKAGVVYPNATENSAIHYEGAEGGYFQYVSATPGTSVHATIESKGTAPQRLLIYARDAADRNLGWVATVAPASSTWQSVAVDYPNLPAETTHIVFVFRGRLLSSQTQTFWFRNATL